MHHLERAEQHQALDNDDQRQHKKLRADVRHQPKIDHALARVYGPLANDFARSDRGAEPERDQSEHEVWKVARQRVTDNQIRQEGDDRRLGKENQQIEFVAAQDFHVPARERAPLADRISDSGVAFGRRGGAAIARQDAERLDDVAPIVFRRLELLLPFVGDLFGDLFPLQFECLLLRLW